MPIETQDPCANLTNIPQYKEWFLTNTDEVFEGIDEVDLPIEQDTGASIVPREKQINSLDVPTIFVEDGEPSGDVYKKFLVSLPFKANSADRARDSDSDYKTVEGEEKMLGGLVTVGTDEQAIARENGNELKETRVPRISQLTSVEEDENTAITGYTITTIDATPTDGIDVSLDVTVETRSNYLVKLTDSILNWVKDSFNKIKTYIDTVDITDGSVTIINTGTSAVKIAKTNATGTDTNKFQADLDLLVSDDETLVGNSATTIVSQRAIKFNLDALENSIADTVDVTTFDSLVTRVETMEDGSSEAKASKLSVTTLSTTVNGKAGKAANESITGTWTFTNSPNVPDGATGSEAINVTTLTSILNNYLTTTANTTQNQAVLDLIAALATRVTTLEGQFAALGSTYYTQAQVNNLLIGKSDTTHNHVDLYHPKVPGAYTGSATLKQSSNIVASNGIITAIAT